VSPTASILAGEFEAIPAGECTAVGVIIAVVIVAGVLIIGVALLRRGPTQLTRRLRSTSFSRRRSDDLRQAAAADVAEVLKDDKYFRRSPGEDTDDL